MSANAKIIGERFELDGALPGVGLRKVSDYLIDPHPFIHMRDAKLTTPDNMTSTVEEVFVGEDTIVMVIPGDDQQRDDSTMVVEKQELSVKIVVGTFTITGTFLIPAAAELESLIALWRDKFLTLRSPVISHPSRHIQSADTVLISMKHMTYMQILHR